ncbi:MAG TPA: protein-tyrosine phosphatase family protein [Ktedonobacteraceae bacterium]|jgi:protein-tyrosine phosphatase|nr:protein-tyrosine phosphatase family protein [Ktedonobacteraceae bacterium]
MRAILYSIDKELPAGKLSIVPRPRGGDWLIDEIKALHEAGVDVFVSLLTPLEVSEFDLAEEATLCSQQGMLYFSFPIPDQSVPAFAEPTFAFLEQLKSFLMEGKHIAFHCRQGLGRSALMAAALLVLSGFEPEEAFTLLSRVRGYRVPETEKQKEWTLAFFQHTFKK